MRFLFNRFKFLGEHLSAVPVHEKLIERFDDEPSYRNQLAVTYLLVNRFVEFGIFSIVLLTHSQFVSCTD